MDTHADQPGEFARRDSEGLPRRAAPIGRVATTTLPAPTATSYCCDEELKGGAKQKLSVHRQPSGEMTRAS